MTGASSDCECFLWQGIKACEHLSLPARLCLRGLGGRGYKFDHKVRALNAFPATTVYGERVLTDWMMASPLSSHAWRDLQMAACNLSTTPSESHDGFRVSRDGRAASRGVAGLRWWATREGYGRAPV